MLLLDEIDKKLRMFVNNTRKAGGTVKKRVVYGVLIGLIKSDLVTVPLQQDELASQNGDNVKACYHKIYVLEVKAKFLHHIVSAVIEHKIPDEFIINVDQTPSKYIPTENVMMAEKNSKHIPRKRGDDKRAITVTLAETLSETILPFQLVYQEKTRRSLPALKFPAGFSLNYNTKH